jgi:hypothetical protein
MSVRGWRGTETFEIRLQPTHPGNEGVVDLQVTDTRCYQAFQSLLGRMKGAEGLDIAVELEPRPNQANQGGVGVQATMVGAGLPTKAFEKWRTGIDHAEGFLEYCLVSSANCRSRYGLMCRPR